MITVWSTAVIDRHQRVSCSTRRGCGEGRQADLDDNEMIWLEERPPHLQEIQRADGGNHDVQLARKWCRHDGGRSGLDVAWNGAMIRRTISRRCCIEYGSSSLWAIELLAQRR